MGLHENWWTHEKEQKSSFASFKSIFDKFESRLVYVFVCMAQDNTRAVQLLLLNSKRINCMKLLVVITRIASKQRTILFMGVRSAGTLQLPR